MGDVFDYRYKRLAKSLRNFLPHFEVNLDGYNSFLSLKENSFNVIESGYPPSWDTLISKDSFEIPLVVKGEAPTLLEFVDRAANLVLAESEGVPLCGIIRDYHYIQFTAIALSKKGV